jgi:deoxyadenosine/deoxycytidine kinase
MHAPHDNEDARPLLIELAGPPGAGKSTQLPRLKSHLYDHLSRTNSPQLNVLSPSTFSNIAPSNLSLWTLTEGFKHFRFVTGSALAFGLNLRTIKRIFITLIKARQIRELGKRSHILADEGVYHNMWSIAFLSDTAQHHQSEESTHLQHITNFLNEIFGAFRVHLLYFDMSPELCIERIKKRRTGKTFPEISTSELYDHLHKMQSFNTHMMGGLTESASVHMIRCTNATTESVWQQIERVISDV